MDNDSPAVIDQASLEIELLTSDGWLREIRHTLGAYKESNVIMDRILLKSRELTSAEAGTVYLIDSGNLVFASSHNDRLFHVDSAHKHAYFHFSMPITADSISGYVALTRESLSLNDVYKLPPEAPYKFDPSMDQRTGYRTISVLAVPIVSRSNKVLGVLQLINSLDKDGNPRSFSHASERLVNIFAYEVAVTVELSQNVRKGINRLMRIANIHDSSETGPHAERVGAIAAEIYHKWAEKRKVDQEQLLYYKGQLRLAAMLHDIGKVGVSDLILKKAGPLTPEERETMCRHTWLGATLFDHETNDLTDLAVDTTLHHHQKWDGTGYSGSPDVPVLSGEDIPLAARITALADVFDALVSPRCYKRTWTFDEAESLMEKEAGKHFDPELVECFFEIKDTICKIYQRYPDE
ncbi:metal-dependent phosphohydrolase [Deltaproteobacteria bacterium Smac51]|nr:metal-dependent phosphohydrolase [Deltaproteobacteria bacterium Smac51]